MNLIILPAHRIWSRGSTVVGPAAATYDANDLCDGSSSQMVRGDGTTQAWTMTFPDVGDVSLIAMINASTVDVDVVISGGVSTTLDANPERPNGLRRNPYAYFATVAGVSAITATITGNTAGIPTIGEFVAGLASEFERHPPESERESYAHAMARSDDYDFQPAEDLNAYGRTYAYTITVTRAGAEFLEEWEDGERAGSAGSLIVPDTDRNDARWGRLDRRIRLRRRGYDVFEATISHREFAMSRWVP